MTSRQRARAVITFAESAVADLEEIRRYYDGRGVSEVGSRLLKEVLAHVGKLGSFPEMGRIVPEFGVVSLREISHPPFRIVYRRDGGCCRVVRIWRSERELKLP